MDTLQPIDQTTWNRREQFAHYREDVPCTFAMTVELDVTAFVDALRRSRRKTYPAQIWALASLVNRHDEFRLGLTEDGSPGTWDVLHPAFTVFRPRSESFAAVSMPFDPDFGRFHKRAVQLLVETREATEFFPQGGLPPNAFDVSSLPWTSFTGFTLHVRHGWDHLLPIFTLGRYLVREGRTLLPLAVQTHHAAVDGFHVARLLTELEELLREPDWLA